jgi:ribosomal protein L7/L12
VKNRQSGPSENYDDLLMEVVASGEISSRPVTQIDLMKALMSAHRLGLKEAKDIVDDFCERKAPELRHTC